jgi:hypothetical protein
MSSNPPLPSPQSSASTRSSIFRGLARETNSPVLSQNSNSNPWDHLGGISHHAIIACTVIGVILVICSIIWFLKTRRSMKVQPSLSGIEPGTLPLHDLHTRPNGAGPLGVAQRVASSRRVTQGGPGMITRGDPGVRAPARDEPPPTYKEEMPPLLRLRGELWTPYEVGLEHGMLADGKIPLSEIPFEDVMLEQASSCSSTRSANQAFAAIHHNGTGDTRGHTNS